MKHPLLIAFFLISSVISAQTQDSDNNKSDSDEVLDFFAPVDEKAMYKDGVQAMYKFIGDYIIIPDSLLSDCQTCTVLVTFIVEKNGGIQIMEIDPRSRKCHVGLEQAALNVVKKMDGIWKPAMLKGQPVRMRFILPIKFAL